MNPLEMFGCLSGPSTPSGRDFAFLVHANSAEEGMVDAAGGHSISVNGSCALVDKPSSEWFGSKVFHFSGSGGFSVSPDALMTFSNHVQAQRFGFFQFSTVGPLFTQIVRWDGGEWLWPHSGYTVEAVIAPGSPLSFNSPSFRAVVADGARHWVCQERDGLLVYLYVDGVLVDTLDFTPWGINSTPPTTEPLLVGFYNFWDAPSCTGYGQEIGMFVGIDPELRAAPTAPLVVAA